MQKRVDKFRILIYNDHEVPNMALLQKEVKVEMDTKAYPNLAGKIAERGIKKNRIATALGISTRALSNKLSGKVAFSWPEVCEMQELFFPDLAKEELLRRAE